MFYRELTGVFFLLFFAPGASAQTQYIPPVLQGIGIDQRLNEQVPLSLEFHDETGKTVRLSDYLGKTPAILILAYYSCPRLCTLVLNGTAEALAKTGLEMGKDYQLITVSFNPNEGPQLAADKKATYLKKYPQTNAQGWHFLTGSQPSITQLTQAVGFHYRWDEKDKQFLHASGIMVLTPQGKLSHYFYGITYPERDLRLSLVDASHGKIGNAVDQVLLFCTSIDLSTGKYTASIWRIAQIFCSLIVLSLAGLVFYLRRIG